MSVAEYTKLAHAASKFAKMCADFPRMGSGEFIAKYPDYDYDGADYVARKAEKLAAILTAYAAKDAPARKRRENPVSA